MRIFVDEAERKRRLEICRACPNSYVRPKLKALSCKLCGCPLASKTRFARAQCPAGKWQPTRS